MTYADKGLGRLPAPDPRDAAYPLRALAPRRAEAPYRYYRTGPVLDQGPLPHCVGYAWRQWLSSAPLMTRTGPDAPSIYHEAQLVDEWPGVGYAGTSVRAGAKVLHAAGRIASYYWAWSVADVLPWVLGGQGCIVLGTDWTTGMSAPDAEGIIRMTGRSLGGHAYLLSGVNQTRGLARILNSWGPAWGRRGRAWLPLDDLDQLLRRDGEACCGVEVAV